MPPFSPDSLIALIDSMEDSNAQAYLQSFYFDCRVKNLASKTIDVYGERLRNFYRFIQSREVPFEGVGASVIQSYILSMKGKVHSSRDKNDQENSLFPGEV